MVVVMLLEASKAMTTLDLAVLCSQVCSAGSRNAKASKPYTIARDKPRTMAQRIPMERLSRRYIQPTKTKASNKTKVRTTSQTEGGSSLEKMRRGSASLRKTNSVTWMGRFSFIRPNFLLGSRGLFRYLAGDNSDEPQGPAPQSK